MRAATEVFGEWALAGKDAGMETGHAPAVQAMLAAALPLLSDNFSAIDLGCGNGWVVRLLNTMTGGVVEGVDGSLPMIEKARSIGPAGSYHCEVLPDWVPPHKVDLIHSMEFLYYLEDPAGMIQQIHDHWLNPGGIFVMGVDHYAEHEASLAWPEHVGVAMTTLTIQQWTQALEDAGFTQIQSAQVGDTLTLLGLANHID
jgi:trans-aconitate methyltransferase